MKRITVTIGGREYPLKVTEDEEGLVHAVEDELNTKLRDLQMAYHKMDKQDCLSMALLTYAFDLRKLQHGETIQSIESTTVAIHDLLDRLLV